ncbi:MAG: DNA-3-methyladenine glycosylase family protein [Chloroflexota bacterium]
MTTDLARAVAILAERDPVLGQIIAEVGPPALERRENFFGSLVGSIVGQQLSVKAAAAIRRRIDGLMPDGAGPTPEGILARTPDELRAAGLSRPKVAYVLDFAAKVRDGTIDLGALAGLDDEAIVRELIQVKGIGRWTVEMFLIFALNRLDVLPVADLGFRAALKRNYGLDHLPKPAEIQQIAESWAPYRTLGTWYMWRSLQNVPTNP